MNRSQHRTHGYGLVLLVLCACAVPASRALSSAPSGHNSQGYLGVDLRDISEDQVASLRLRDNHGAEIVLVDHDAPAGKAGLHEHDVVLQMNGQAIYGGDQIRRMLHECPSGKMVVLLISRDGQQMTVQARLSTKEEVERQAREQHFIPPTEPQDSAASESAASGNSSTSAGPAPAVKSGNSFIGSILMSPSYTGAALEQMTTQLAQFFGVPTGTGLLVRSVIDNSPAAQAGMHAGDVVVRANDKPVTSTGDWYKAVKNSHGHALSVVVLRDKKEQTLTLTPDSKKRSSLEELIEDSERTVVSYLSLSRTFLP